jgi:hypothetical protein
VARSYKSALPTWSTYTPHVGPMGVQAPINQEVLWRNRTHGWTPPSTKGEFNRIAMSNAQMVKGTGAGPAAVAIGSHRPIMNAAAQRVTGSFRNWDERRAWAQQMQTALHQGDQPEGGAAPDETATPNVAPPSVNPANVATQQAAQAGIDTLAGEAIESSDAGTSTAPRIILPGLSDVQKYARK